MPSDQWSVSMYVAPADPPTVLIPLFARYWAIPAISLCAALMPKKVCAYWLLAQVISGPMDNVRRSVGWYFASTVSDANTPSWWATASETDPRTDSQSLV